MINLNKNIILNNNNSQTGWDKYIPKPYKKVAGSMEKECLNFMISKMNQTVKSDTKNSSAMDYYQGIMNKERSSIMAKNNGGVGIQKLILDQIYPSHLRNKVTYEYFKRSQEKNNPQQVIKKYKANEDIEKEKKINNLILKKEIKNE